MTTEQRVSATDTGVPQLKSYLSEMQAKAMHIEHLLAVVDYLEGEGTLEGGRWIITTQALRLAKELNVGLDSLNLPKVAQ